MIINMQVILPLEDKDKLDLIILVLIILIEIFNSNVIYISHDLIKGYGLVKPNYRDYYNAIAYLEDENIIKRTNIRNIYVVNPIYIFRGDVNKLINIINEAKLIKTFDDKDRLIVDKFVLFKNDTDKGIVIANKDLYATEVVDIGED